MRHLGAACPNPRLQSFHPGQRVRGLAPFRWGRSVAWQVCPPKRRQKLTAVEAAGDDLTSRSLFDSSPNARLVSHSDGIPEKAGRDWIAPRRTGSLAGEKLGMARPRGFLAPPPCWALFSSRRAGGNRNRRLMPADSNSASALFESEVGTDARKLPGFVEGLKPQMSTERASDVTGEDGLRPSSTVRRTTLVYVRSCNVLVSSKMKLSSYRGYGPFLEIRHTHAAWVHRNTLALKSSCIKPLPVRATST